MKRFRALIWDIDGVLIDSEPLHLEALNRVCAERCGWILDAAENTALLGLSLPAMYDYFRNERTLPMTEEQWLAAIEDDYVAHLSSSMIRAGVANVIERLRQEAIPMACVSTAERRIVDANLAAIGVAGYMMFSLARTDVKRTKPDPEPYLTACHRLGIAPSDCLVVEDTVVGLESARHAGCGTIAFPHGMSSPYPPGAADHICADLLAFDWAMAFGLGRQ